MFSHSVHLAGVGSLTVCTWLVWGLSQCALGWCEVSHSVHLAGVGFLTVCTGLVWGLSQCALGWCGVSHSVHWAGVFLFTLHTDLHLVLSGFVYVNLVVVDMAPCRGDEA